MLKHQRPLAREKPAKVRNNEHEQKITAKNGADHVHIDARLRGADHCAPRTAVVAVPKPTRHVGRSSSRATIPRAAEGEIFAADGIARATAWESRKSPGLIKKPACLIKRAFVHYRYCGGKVHHPRLESCPLRQIISFPSIKACRCQTAAPSQYHFDYPHLG
jgi:hypothetical protein